MNLHNQTAIIIGGGGAIGRATALRLAREGAAVAICDIRQEPADRVADEIRAAGGNAIAAAIDLRQTADIDRVIDEIAQHWGNVDILVNSAGGSARQKNALLRNAEEEVIDAILDVNLRGVIYTCRAALRHMTQQHSGKIVNIASIVGIQGKAKLLDYAASKAGVIALTKTLAMESGPDGIRVNCVSPGIVPRAGEAQNLDYIRQTNFLGKIGRPEDIANMAAFLVSEEASFITGQNFIVDGGRSLGLKES